MGFELEQSHIAIEFEATTSDIILHEDFPPTFLGQLIVNNGHSRATVNLTLEELEKLVVALRGAYNQAIAVREGWQLKPLIVRQAFVREYNAALYGDEWMKPSGDAQIIGETPTSEPTVP